jgi:hypothetical protein
VDISRDELYRQLKGVDADQKAAMRPWRESLLRIFGSGGTALPPAAKAQLVGVPGRRQFLKIGGVSILGAAVLAACGDDDSTSSGTTLGGSATTVAGGSGVDDVTLLKTATSLELLAVATYQTAAGSGLVTTKAVGDAAGLFLEHHQAHADALQQATSAAGADPFDQPNAAVKAAIVDPAVMAAKTEADILKLAFDLEAAAAQTYVFAASALSKPEYRSTIMTIGSVESRHQQILGAVLKLGPAALFPGGFYKSDNPLPAEALVS